MRTTASRGLLFSILAMKFSRSLGERGLEGSPLHNEFRGDSVAKAVRSLHHEGSIMEAKFGREGSPVLYINPPYWTNQASNWVKREEYSPRKYTENERSK